MSSAPPPSVAVARVYERLNRRGKRILVGRLGVAKLLIIETAGESRGERIWHVHLGHGPLPLDELVPSDADDDHG